MFFGRKITIINSVLQKDVLYNIVLKPQLRRHVYSNNGCNDQISERQELFWQ